MDNEKREFENSEIEQIVESEVVLEDITDSEIVEEEVIDEVVTDEIIENEEISEVEETLSEEEIEIIKAEKKRKRVKILSVSAIAVAVIFIAGLIYSLCVINGVGTKTVVNTELPAKYSAEGEKLEQDSFDIKFKSPFVSLFAGKKGDVLTVNGYGIDAETFNYFVKGSALNYEFQLYENKKITDLDKFDWNAIDEETSLKNSEIAKGEAVKSVSTILAVIAEGEKRGLSLTEDEEKELTDWIAQVKESYGDNLETALTQSGYDSVEQLEKIQKLQRIYQKSYEAFMEEPLSYVKQFKDYAKALSSDKITALHVLVQFPEGITRASTEEEKAETKKKAQEVLTKAKAGEDFSELIFSYNDDPGQTKYGYTFANDGSMVAEFADAAFDLEINEISDVVETDFGYHIIKRTERIPDFDEYIELVEDNMKVRINSFIYSDIVVDADLSEVLGEASAQTETSAE